MEIKTINDKVSVSPQISPNDLPAIKEAGFTTIINNRPDGEAPDQPDGALIEQEARNLGLEYIAIPMGRDGVSPDMIEATKNAMASEGKVFAYCRSGTRSTTLWALSQAGEMPADEIIKSAANAGYDVSHLAQYLSE
ncbi:TIGR01244 family sulfur transferase [Maritalea mediterranea]|uniref:TIGR01244 family sulfur transferase n=1 Tax=Maritalea mediterranea TaxID=2909667 RepID=A0ABS9E925_9HYPH|nr:TIGR01244 family sulfur transferase [Maritalea mediterranea]MCF4099385.1 TIGR01244 family sulfur transferase [Maritalea mediterranea]